MNYQKTIRFLILLALFSASFLFNDRAEAVPAWSRRYGVACGTCHAFPSLQLTATGLDFFRRGHRMAGDTTDKDITHLLSAHGEWDYEVKNGESNPFESPEFHLHAGGAFSQYFSAYVDAGINEE